MEEGGIKNPRKIASVIAERSSALAEWLVTSHTAIYDNPPASLAVQE
jgi:hypothetical protein